jgi:hypothetical protein
VAKHIGYFLGFLEHETGLSFFMTGVFIALAHSRGRSAGCFFSEKVFHILPA